MLIANWTKWLRNIYLAIDSLWSRNRQTILALAIGLMTGFGVRFLFYEFQRLLRYQGVMAAIDLKQRYQEVQAWFAGEPVYGQIDTAVYPPASYALLQPFLGYPSFTFVRWIWGVTTVAALIGLIYLSIKATKARGSLEAGFVAVMVLSMYATGETVGNGQLTIHVLAALVAGMTLFNQPGRSPKLIASALFIAALVKPNLTIPFFLIVLIVFGIGPALMVSLGYVLIALVGGIFQAGNIFSLYHDWLLLGAEGAEWGSAGGGSSADGATFAVGYANIHNWLGALGLNEWNLVASLLVLLALGFWIYLHRSVDLWILLGVTAIAARLWTYHLVYDDLLVLLPMLALFRITKQNLSHFIRVLSGTLLGVAVVASITAPRFRLYPYPWDLPFKVGQLTVWVMMLIFLIYLAWYQKQAKISPINYQQTIS